MTRSENEASDFDSLGQGSSLEEFKEVEEVKSIIASLQTIYEDDIAVEMAQERFLYIVDQYQEQPHLLDPHLETVLTQMLDVVKQPDAPDKVIHLSFRLMYLLTKTRGYKVIVRLLPHEVADLEPVLAMLNKQSAENYLTWESRYMLLLWLSMVSMVPFDMVRLDSHAQDEAGNVRQPIMDRIIDAGQRYLGVSDKSRDAAAFMLSKFMTRPDVKNEKLPSFLDWCLVTITKADLSTLPGHVVTNGVLSTLASLFKYGKREDLLDYAPAILKQMMAMKIHESNNTVLRKMVTKMIQRLGLVFLKTRVATWRYTRGSRSLVANLTDPGSMKNHAAGEMSQSDDIDDEYDVPEEIEDVIEHLLTALKDKDTVVRWSAAKGIGRITGRLPSELANEVVGSVLELFTIRETDAAWHGGCLSLAELGRRGLLLPERLPDVVPIMIKALNYDEKRGYFSVGAHVRDAACYVCWAFARAYDPEQLKPHVKTISSALVIVSVFDREVNVRRAAAAAFQENVGRQGQFPHGIDILTTCDYFAVGSRFNCYCELAAFVAQFPDYTIALIDHLVNVKSNHWDINIRELCSQSLHILTKFADDYMATTVLPILLKLCLSMDVNQRHGAILAVAEITHALAKIAASKNKLVDHFVGTAEMEGMKNIVIQMKDMKLYRGVGGELMRKASCILIDRLSLSKLPYQDSPVITAWQELIDDCLHQVEPDIQHAAVDAIPAFMSQYYIDSDGKAPQAIQDAIIEKYTERLNDNVETIRMGYALALGAMPQIMLKGKVQVVLLALIQACSIEKDQKMAEARRDAIKALKSICYTVGVMKDGTCSDKICTANISLVFDALFAALKDYTLDSRGDVGAWVREASMTALHDLLILLIKDEPSLITDDISRTMFVQLVQQACEKIDRTRAHAGEIFGKLLYHEPPLPGIPDVETLHSIFPKADVDVLNWSVAGSTFPLFTRLIAAPDYTYNVLLGLTVSVGGLTESLVKSSSDSLLDYLKSKSEDEQSIQSFVDTLFKIFTDHEKIDRVTLPMFKMLDQLLSNGCFDILTDAGNCAFPQQLLEQSKKEVSKSGDIQKLLASIDVFCGLLQFPDDVRKKTLMQLSIFLCHRFPIVRKTTSQKLYESLILYDDIVDEDKMDEVMTILSETQWDQPVAEVRPLRNQLCSLLNIPPPKLLMKKPQNDGDSAS